MSTRTPLVLVGAGGLGREALAATRAGTPWHVVGFVDDAAEVGSVVDGVPVLGSVAQLAAGELATEWLHEDAATDRLSRDAAADRLPALICTGRPGHTRSRHVIAEKLAAAGIPFATVVHPTASVAVGATIGEGSLLLAHVAITAPITVGRHVVVMPQCVFTHDDVIGDYTMFGAGVRLAGGVQVEAGAYVGSGALVREYLTIGAGSLVGMGAVVTRSVPAGETWIGHPARPRRVDESGS